MSNPRARWRTMTAMRYRPHGDPLCRRHPQQRRPGTQSPKPGIASLLPRMWAGAPRLFGGVDPVRQLKTDPARVVERVREGMSGLDSSTPSAQSQARPVAHSSARIGHGVSRRTGRVPGRPRKLARPSNRECRVVGQQIWTGWRSRCGVSGGAQVVKRLGAAEMNGFARFSERDR